MREEKHLQIARNREKNLPFMAITFLPTCWHHWYALPTGNLEEPSISI